MQKKESNKRSSVQNFTRLAALCIVCIFASHVSKLYESAVRDMACNPLVIAKICNSPCSIRCTAPAMSHAFKVCLLTFCINSCEVSIIQSNTSPRKSWTTCMLQKEMVMFGWMLCSTFVTILVRCKLF